MKSCLHSAISYILVLVLSFPGQFHLEWVCKSKEVLRGLDRILQLPREVCRVTQPNFANAAGMKTLNCLLNILSLQLARCHLAEMLEINFAVVCHEFQQANLDVVLRLFPLPLRIPSAIPLFRDSLRCRQTSMSTQWRRRSATSVSEHLKVFLL